MATKRISVSIDASTEIAARRAMLEWKAEAHQRSEESGAQQEPAHPVGLGELIDAALIEYLEKHAPDSLDKRPGRPPKRR